MTLQRQQGARVGTPASVPNQPPANVNPQTEEPLSPTFSSSSSQGTQSQEDVEEEYVVLPQVPKNAPATAATAQNQKTPAVNSSTVETSNQQAANSEKEAMQIGSYPSSSQPKEPSSPPTTILQDTLRLTRARMRRTPSAGN